MGIKKAIEKTMVATTNVISGLSQLSPKELAYFEGKRQEYLKSLQNPKLQFADSTELIGKLIGNIGVEVYQAYLPLLDFKLSSDGYGNKKEALYCPIECEYQDFEVSQRIRYFEITKLVSDKEEKSIQKLANIYQSMNNEDVSIALIYDRRMSECHIYVAIANHGKESHFSKANGFVERIMGAFKGNFPGAEFSNFFSKGIPECLKYGDGETASISVVSNLPSEKSENFISQSIEKLIDGIVPFSEREEYTIVLLAEPEKNLQMEKTNIFDSYSVLSPYASWQTNQSVNEGESHSDNFGATINAGIGLGPHDKAVHGNFGASLSKSSTVSLQLGMTSGISQDYTNYAVKHTLDLLEQQMKRIEKCSALGMWNSAAYFISKDYNTTKNIANMYLSLTEGDESYMSETAVNTWGGNDISAKGILQFLAYLRHPVFRKNEVFQGVEEWELYPNVVDATVRMSGSELAYSLNFPRRSVSGIPVLESVSFGREVHKFGEAIDKSQTITVGHVYHMRRVEENAVVQLDIPSLTSHTFITGSTGTGKSNTVYQLLDKLHEQGCKYMVIEPAKGEYKNVFGGREDVEVYGTNPMKTGKLLQINPFSFPDEVHVLEHIDRLVEILNACWPMYAAMPAVMKDAIEKSYEKYGWNLRTSLVHKEYFQTLGICWMNCRMSWKVPFFPEIRKVIIWGLWLQE